MEVVLRQIGYTLEEINTMSERHIVYRFLIGQKLLAGGEGETAGRGVVSSAPPPPPPPARGVRQRPSGSSYNFPR